MVVSRIEDLSLDTNTVFLRGDMDVSTTNPLNDPRMEAVVETSGFLLEKGAQKVIVAGHKGRPEGKPNAEDSLKFLVAPFADALETEVLFVSYDDMEAFSRQELYDPATRVYLLENLRFWEGEKNNNPEFVNLLVGSGADIYVNEAFATSHREHASIIGVPKAILEKGGQVAFGFRFCEEVEHLSRVLDDPSKPAILYLSGVKKDKLQYIDLLKGKFDRVMIGGRLPEYLGDVKVSVRKEKGKVIVGELQQDKEDITLHTIERFEKEAMNAETIVLSGPFGKYEDEGQRLGTKRLFEAIAISKAYKVAGGGDTEAALELFGLSEKFDWVSVGGGAMLEFLSKGTLPGIEAICD